MLADNPKLVNPVTEEFAFVVECSPVALNGIGRRRARVLFGRKTETAVHVLASKPFPFPYVTTVGYSLSEPEEAKLEELLRSCESDPRLRGMIPVGWYVPRGGRALGSGDEFLFERFFPEPWQIALVGTREGVFYCFRGLDGAVYSEPFPIAPARKAIWPRVTAVAAVMILLAALVLLLWRPAARSATTRRAAGRIGLGVSEKAGQLHIRWERSPEVEAAVGAELEIEDGGGRMRVRLDRTGLLTGSVFYSRWSGSATVRMVLDRPGLPPIEESVTFSGRPVTPVAPVAADVPPAPLLEEEPAPPVLNVPVRVRGEAERAGPREEPPQRLFRAPRPVLRAAAQPVLDAPELAVAPQTPYPLPLAQRPRPVPAAERPPAAVGARGQVIWTGRLERRGVLEIEGPRATVGHVSGALPQAPADITVLPGELTETGLRLYTANSRLANRVEPAGPQNGWNRTEYVWDPLRVKEISVLEAPGQHNDWKHLVLRAEHRGYSVVVVQWQARP